MPVASGVALVVTGLMSFTVAVHGAGVQHGGRGKSEPLNKDAIARMRQSGSYKDGCPVPPEQLRRLAIPHWNFQKEIELGAMIVHAAIAEEVLDIFQELRKAGYPVQTMKLIDEYEANDEASMRDNNTSAFNCRPITGTTGNFSNHSYGTAIDINPVQNPYLKIKDPADASVFLNQLPAHLGDGQLPHELTIFCKRLPNLCQILPVEGAQYLNRDGRGVIVNGDAVYRAFVKRGWTWGGNWPSSRTNRVRTDYQHFEKAGATRRGQ